MVLPLKLFEVTITEKFCNFKPFYQNDRLLNFIKNKKFVLPGDLEDLEWCR